MGEQISRGMALAIQHGADLVNAAGRANELARLSAWERFLRVALLHDSGERPCLDCGLYVMGVVWQAQRGHCAGCWVGRMGEMPWGSPTLPLEERGEP